MATTPPDPKEGSGPKEEYIAGISRTPSPPLLAMDVTPGTQGSFIFSPPPKPGPINPAPQDRAQQELIGDAQLRLDGVFCTISNRLQYLTLAHHLVQLVLRKATPDRYDNFLGDAQKAFAILADSKGSSDEIHDELVGYNAAPEGSTQERFDSCLRAAQLQAQKDYPMERVIQLLCEQT